MIDQSVDDQFYLTEIVNKDIPGVTRVQANQHLEACLVCLDHHQHSIGIRLTIKKSPEEVINLHWDDIVNEHIRRSWMDLDEATEYGATAIAILLVIKRTEYTIIERSVKGTGFDYWLLEKDAYDIDELFPIGTARLEVSGMMHAQKESEIHKRVKEKIAQTGKSDAEKQRLPALIIVVEFSHPEVHMVSRL